MPDPFEALRTAPTPIDPDPAFATRLRARVARVLQPSIGETMITADSGTTNKLRQGDMTYVSLFVNDLERAAKFYSTVLGWTMTATEAGNAQLVDGQSLSMGVASLELTLQFMARLGLKVPGDAAPGGFVTLVVDDLDAAVERVRAGGGQATTPSQFPYGRLANCVDDQGLLFGLQQGTGGPRPPAAGSKPGDIAYLVFEFPDSSRARAFYENVLGWQFSPGRGQDGWNIADTVPMSGMAGGRARARIIPMFRVDDIQAAVQRAHTSGGTATEPVHEGYGTRAECTDDQGTTFYLGQL